MPLRAKVEQVFSPSITFDNQSRLYKLHRSWGRIFVNEHSKRFYLAEEPFFKEGDQILITKFSEKDGEITIVDYSLDNETDPDLKSKREQSRLLLDEQIKKENYILKKLKGKIEAKILQIDKGNFVYLRDKNSWIYEQKGEILVSHKNIQKKVNVSFTNNALFRKDDEVIFQILKTEDLIDFCKITCIVKGGSSDPDLEKINNELERRNQLSKKKINIIGLDIDEYYRCPYRMSVCEEKGIKPIDLLTSEFVKEYVIKPGQEFEDKVMSAIDWKQTEESVSDLIDKGATIRNPLLTLKGDKLKAAYVQSSVMDYIELGKITFFGRPDMIFHTKKGYVALDIKHHSGIQKTDILRITYYSFLLKYIYSPNSELNNGYIFLRNGEIVEVDVNLYAKELLELIVKINEAKRGYNEPKLCTECRTCKLYDSCIKYLEEKQGLTLVYQIGPSREKKLNEIGINTISELAKQNPEEIRSLTGASGWTFIGMKIDPFRSIVMYARALIKKEPLPIVYPDLPTDITEIYFDLEYIPGETNFLYGIAIKKEGKINYHQFFSEDDNSQGVCTNFLKLIGGEKKYVIYTWCGMSADMPQLKLDMVSLNKITEYGIVSENHIDLYKKFVECIALPLYSYSLKEVTPYLKIPDTSTVIKDGFACLFAYGEYMRTKNEKVKKDIMEYNLEDLKKLIEVKQWMDNFFKDSDEIDTTFEQSGDFVPLKFSSLPSSIHKIPFSVELYPQNKINMRELVLKNIQNPINKLELINLCEQKGAKLKEIVNELIKLRREKKIFEDTNGVIFLSE